MMKPFRLVTILWALSLTLLGSPAFADAHNFTAETSNIATKTVNLIKDSAITAYIYAQLALDKNLSKENISVSTDAGKVTVDGTVDSDTEASTVVQLASSVSGVTSVDTAKLKIRKSTQPFTDLVITAKVKGTFIRENLFDNKDLSADINVETKNGVVYLSGNASNLPQVQHAINLAKSISGVKRVESSIKVGRAS